MRSRSVLLLCLALAACEGEPPKTAVGAVAVANEPTPAAVEEPTAAAPAATTPLPVGAASAAGSLPPCACACNCGNNPTVAVADGGATPAPPAAVAAATAPAVAAAASILGSVTTTPKWAAGAAVVYLEDAPVLPTAKMTATVTNHMMVYTPLVSVVPVGGKVIFRNDDPFPHNVFSPDNEKFNMGMLALGEARSHVFPNAGNYALLCNVHPAMLGYLVVTPSSYYAKADAQGHFAIKGVPPGTYKVTAWAPRQKTITQTVTLKDTDVTTNFELHR